MGLSKQAQIPFSAWPLKVHLYDSEYPYQLRAPWQWELQPLEMLGVCSSFWYRLLCLLGRICTFESRLRAGCLQTGRNWLPGVPPGMLPAVQLLCVLHFQAVLGILIRTSTNKSSLKTVGSLHLWYVPLSLKSASQSNHAALENEVLCESGSYFLIEHIAAPKQRGEMTSTDSCIRPS